MRSTLDSTLGTTAATASTYLSYTSPSLTITIEADPVLTTRWLSPPAPQPSPPAPPTAAPALGDATASAIEEGGEEGTLGLLIGIALAARTRTTL